MSAKKLESLRQLRIEFESLFVIEQLDPPESCEKDVHSKLIGNPDWDSLTTQRKWQLAWTALAMQRNSIRGMALVRLLLREQEHEPIPPIGKQILAELIAPRGLKDRHFDIVLKEQESTIGAGQLADLKRDFEIVETIFAQSTQMGISLNRAIEEWCESSPGENYPEKAHRAFARVRRWTKLPNVWEYADKKQP
jgi:hypothetical protein